jgi:hypothetical protein
MSNRNNIPEEVERHIRHRDKLCVYCRKKMISPCDKNNLCDSATIEHFKEGPLNREKPFIEKDVGICCWSCNSSRREKTLFNWFETKYCRDRKTPINEQTVAEVVKNYIARNEKC